MKALTTALLSIMGVTLTVPTYAAADKCKVVAKIPANANFFSGRLNPVKPPVIGDEVDLDLKAADITDLTFKSGNSIGLKSTGTKLTRVSAAADSVVRFEGKLERTNTYIGTLLAQPFSTYEYSVMVNISSGPSVFEPSDIPDISLQNSLILSCHLAPVPVADQQ